MPKSCKGFAEIHPRTTKSANPVGRTIVILVVVFAAVVVVASAFAVANAQDVKESQVDVAYVEPKNPDFRPYYDELKRRQVLEELQQFLSPLRLPRKVLVKTDECGSNIASYEPGKPIIVCYEYVERIVKLAPAVKTPTGISRENAIVGAFVQFVLHEMSLAVFDFLQVPVWGREQDAADKLAAFVMLQFGTDLAIRTFTGAVWFFEASNRTWTGSDFASETSPEAQRFYNYLCIAYGGDPDAFKDIVRDTLLETYRARRCHDEYRKLKDAFQKIIMPHVDPVRLQLVQSMQWVKPEN